ncbi:hypothetical protein BK649_18250 [Pseudomonas canadensis]|uniref:Uncharacterized protein n=1 Tax=Pseudomonas canadensis TaxID=915099 RepID=A0A423F444_9PSED|nr:hypothetical protein BK649_18250 [Pseudomonas canadensis]
MNAPQLKAIMVAAAQCVIINFSVKVLKWLSRLKTRRNNARMALDSVILYMINVMDENSLSAFQ